MAHNHQDAGSNPAAATNTLSTREIEIIGASGHGIGLTINLLGFVWNRKGTLFFRLFHLGAAGVHAYALYTHICRAREENG